MKLITHNILTCVDPRCKKEPPSLTLAATKVSVEDSKFDEAFIVRMIDRIDYPTLLTAYREVAPKDSPVLPPEVPKEPHTNKEFLKALYYAVCCIVIEEGEMICPRCARSYPIRGSIPNMILRPMDEEEIKHSSKRMKVDKEEADEEEGESKESDNDEKKMD
ncbi:putative multifunctional methyltransferase subunit TRM112 [Monocercomonoides exilis]|uniref:putative multifunctional methyltransferase subunit TRM112 n=1 Tax=Monocercomonoides exilis TaxID=2049356 RepID=UPI003559B068|nr:putative multifunctional methyltransferase subunit TRM112 [Monocercomonoides exilis]|eukprot:MONOS_75.1-p1 / transcript=MONOS_75.1 / gene=MONOS_75 / organism=Monocercomonoides_exilis_PA203 / gene_product=unspecified product / transcript_product=unspecified product / location=Mono_scaffold00001:379747-380416(-) / protein_length=161 / sequence_SO=supercontig / SO=protein_coding / is_pseudo=false